jgi:colanic acid/amylovoran biosynthesis protein
LRIAITNSVALNGGDAAITLALHEALRQRLPDASLEVHDANPAAARKYYPDIRWSTQLASLLGPTLGVPKLRNSKQRATEIRLLASLSNSSGSHHRPVLLSAHENEFFSDIAQVDLMISTGGTYLVEQYSLHTRLFEYRVAKSLGIPVIFFTQSLGPFRARRNRRILRAIFERSPLVLLRDEESLANVRDLGVTSPHLSVAADAVFLTGDTHIDFRARRQAPDPWRIGISVRMWPPGATVGHPDVSKFSRALAETVTHLARKLPANFVFISTCQGTPEYHIDDSALASHIAESLPPDVRERVQVDRSFHTPLQFRDIVSSFDLMIATRMHACIQSLTVGTPVVPIAYEFKTRQLATRLGIEDYTLDIQSMSGPGLTSTVLTFIDHLDELRAHLVVGVRGQRSTAEAGMTQLADTLVTARRGKDLQNSRVA